MDQSPFDLVGVNVVTSELQLDVFLSDITREDRPLAVSLRISDYDEVQEALSAELARQGPHGWSVNTDHWHQGGTYQSGGGFTSMLPLVLARRSGPDLLSDTAATIGERPESEQAWLAQHLDGWSVIPASMRIDIYDLGMGVTNGIFTLRVPDYLDLHTIVTDLKRAVWLKTDDAGVLSPISSTFRVLAEETARQFSDAVERAAPSTIDEPWLAPFLTAAARGRSDRSPAPDWGRLLWLHPLHLIEVDDAQEIATDADQVAPSFHRVMEIPDGRFVPGIGWSALVTRHQPAGINVPIGLLELHWAYIALYMEIDRGLLALLDQSHHLNSLRLSDLEADAERVFGDYIRVMEARARVDSTLASPGGDEQAVWDVIADVTKFDALVQGVDRKVQALQRIAERRVQQGSATRSHRTTAILSFLTALTVVTVTTALITNFLGSRSDQLGHLPLRVAIVVAALVASVGLYREAFKERPRRRE
jgi:hypothetical protein